MGRKRVCFINIIIILSSLILILAPNNTVAVGTPVVNLEFDEGEETQEADVRPGESGYVTFPGTVSADLAAGGSVQDVLVNLEAWTEEGWPASVTPSTLLLQPGTEEAEFLATVTVPPETSSSIVGTLYVGGTAEAFPGSLRYSIQSITGTIIIKQYYKFSISCDQPYQECCPDSEMCYNLSIFNEGNGNDSFDIHVTNLEDLTLNSLTVTLGSNTIPIPEKSDGQISILVRTPDVENINRVYKIELAVKSVMEEQNEGYAKPLTYDLSIRVKSGSSTVGTPPSDDNGDGDDGTFDIVDDEGGINFGLTLGIIIVIVAVVFIGIIVWVNRKQRQ